MKLASYEINGKNSYGVVVEDGLVDVGSKLGTDLPNVRAVLEADAIDKIGDAAVGQSADFNFSEVNFLPPITNPDMIICIGANYKSFLADVGESPPTEPTYFHRRSSAQVGQ